MKKITPTLVLGVILLGLLATFLNMVSSYQHESSRTQDQFSIPEGWKTYTNLHYGYQISFPNHVTVKSSSKPNSQNVGSSEDFVIFLMEELDEGNRKILFPIQMETQHKARNTKDLISLYQQYVIPNYLVNNPNISEEDFDFEEIKIGRTPALRVHTPETEVTQIINHRNEIISIIVMHRPASAKPDKLLDQDLLVTDIVNSFKLLH